MTDCIETVESVKSSEIDVPEPFIRSQVTKVKTMVEQSVETLKEYSPQSVSLLETGYNRVEAVVPDNVKKMVEETLQNVTSVVEQVDDLLLKAHERTSEFPVLINDVKSTFTREELFKLINTVQTEAGEKINGISKYLPSESLKDLKLKERVQEIVTMITSQVDAETLRLKAVEATEHVKKVTVGDVVSGLYKITDGSVSYTLTLFSLLCTSVSSHLNTHINLAENAWIDSFMNAVQTNPTTKPMFENLVAQWNKIKEFFAPVYQHLYTGSKIVKMFVEQYANNVGDKYVPLAPYLTDIVASTTVVDFPFEVLRLIKTAGGYREDNKRAEVLKESKALFWALIDLSFVTSLVQTEIKDVTTTTPQQGEQQTTTTMMEEEEECSGKKLTSSNVTAKEKRSTDEVKESEFDGGLMGMSMH